MNPEEFEAKMRSLPAEELDEIDEAMLAEADAMDDGTTITLEELRRELLLADANRILSEFAEDYQQLATHPDPFYSAGNLSHLRRAIADLDAGRGTPHDLTAVAMRDEYNIPELNPRANPYVNDGKQQAGFGEDYKRTADSDTQYLSSIPGMVDSIKAAQQEPVEECFPYDPNENW